MFIKFVENNVPIIVLTNKKVEGSLFNYLCIMVRMIKGIQLLVQWKPIWKN